MNWLSSPKVRLALIVNGLYFLSFFTPAARHRQPHFFTSVHESGGRLHVSLKDDLTLMDEPGRRLHLSASFRARPQEEPGWVTLRFMLFSNTGTYPEDCLLAIRADGVPLWPDSARGGRNWASTAWSRERVPRSVTKLDGGQVLETLGAESLSMELPYDLFLKMISAKRLVIILGPDRAELTADQVEALRDMHRRLQ